LDGGEGRRIWFGVSEKTERKGLDLYHYIKNRSTTLLHISLTLLHISLTRW
jgi:hypothetical protein